MSGGIAASLLLDAITPAQDAVDAVELSYPNLKEIIQKFYPFQYEQTNVFQSEPSGSEIAADRELSHEYLLMIAQQLQEADEPDEREFWTKRYTEASIKVYGQPIANEVASIATVELNILEDAAELLGSPRKLIVPVLEEYQSLAGDRSVPVLSLEERYAPVLRAIRDYFVNTYDDVLACFDDLEDGESLQAPQIIEHFNKALRVLQQYDPAWKEWSAGWHESATLSVDVLHKRINVGRYRAPLHYHDAKGLFAHEVLVHAQRGMNGAKIDENLAFGLPGYIEAEEGLGVLVESAINGRIAHKIKDRYVDIALALGSEYKQPMNRRELFAIAYSRALIRNLVDDKVFNIEQLKFLIWTHVNRIYRGTLGNEYIGVFTKDVAYYKGFCKIADYLAKQLEQGKSIDESIEYMLRGKFDPCKKRHLSYLRSHM